MGAKGEGGRALWETRLEPGEEMREILIETSKETVIADRDIGGGTERKTGGGKDEEKGEQSDDDPLGEHVVARWEEKGGFLVGRSGGE